MSAERMGQAIPAIELRTVDVGCHTCLALNTAMKERALDVAMYMGILIGVAALRPGAFVPLCAHCRERWDLFKPALAALLMSRTEIASPPAPPRAESDFVCGDYDLRASNPRGGDGHDFFRCANGAAYECGQLLVCSRHFAMRRDRGDDVSQFKPLLIWNPPEPPEPSPKGGDPR